MNEIEMMLWEYMDGTCSQDDMQRISVLIERDELWKQKYAELSAFQAELQHTLQTGQPSMRFTKNVMDAVAQVSVAPATTKYINKSIIRGIAAFFIITIAATAIYALATTNWSAADNGALSHINYPAVQLSSYFNSTLVNVIIAVNVVLGLVFLDSVLKRKREQHGEA